MFALAMPYHVYHKYLANGIYLNKTRIGCFKGCIMFTDILRDPGPFNGGGEITYFTLLQKSILWKYLLFKF